MLNSKTYLYQRNGVFYIRLRMKTTGHLTASLPSHNRYKLASVSLRIKDRGTATVLAEPEVPEHKALTWRLSLSSMSRRTPITGSQRPQARTERHTLR